VRIDFFYVQNAKIAKIQKKYAISTNNYKQIESTVVSSLTTFEKRLNDFGESYTNETVNIRNTIKNLNSLKYTAVKKQEKQIYFLYNNLQQVSQNLSDVADSLGVSKNDVEKKISNVKKMMNEQT